MALDPSHHILPLMTQGLVVLSSEGIIQAIVLMMMDVATVSIGPNMVLDALPIPWVF
jgi:hypothetical protein